jgi:hypothetical protein
VMPSLRNEETRLPFPMDTRIANILRACFQILCEVG